MEIFDAIRIRKSLCDLDGVDHHLVRVYREMYKPDLHVYCLRPVLTLQ